MHAAQHAPVVEDVKELRAVCADAITSFGLPASDPMLADARSLLSRLESLETTKSAAEADVQALLQKLEVGANFQVVGTRRHHVKIENATAV